MMPIINEIDEENQKNSRTIDTDTGVYLKYNGANGWERIATFVMSDGETIFHINAAFSNKLDEANKTNKYNYLVNLIDIVGNPKRCDYSDLIRKLFNVHGWHYRRGEKKFGNIQSVKVEFKKEVLTKLIEWEASYAN